MSMIWFRVAVAIAVSLPRVHSEIPSDCPRLCTCEHRTVTCEGRGLFAVPDGVQRDVSRLRLADNNLTALDVSTFTRYDSLSQLDISRNNIASVSSDSFNTLVLMAHLNMSHNTLTQLPSAIFADLINLDMIDLSYNQLVDSRIDLREAAESLTQIYLQGNRLTSRVFGMLNKATWLHIVYVSNNPLYHLPYQMLHELENLQVLVVNNAMLEHIDPNAFIGLEGLTELHMNGNKIVELRREMFQPLSGLSFLDISGNAIVCTCGVKQFQDWLWQLDVSLVASPSCQGNTSEISIQTGNFTSLCGDPFTYGYTTVEPSVENSTMIHTNDTVSHTTITDEAFNVTDLPDTINNATNALLNFTETTEPWTSATDATIVTTESTETLATNLATASAVNLCAEVIFISVKLRNVTPTSPVLTWDVQGHDYEPTAMVVISSRQFGNPTAEYVWTAPIDQRRFSISNMNVNASYSICLTLRGCSNSFVCEDVNRMKDTPTVPMIVDSACLQGAAKSTVVLWVLTPLLAAMVTFLLVVHLCTCKNKESKNEALQLRATPPSNGCNAGVNSTRYQNAVRYQRNPVGATRSDAIDREGHTYESISAPPAATRGGFVNIGYINESRDREILPEHPSVHYSNTDDEGYLKPVDTVKRSTCGSREVTPSPAQTPPKRRRADSGYKSEKSSAHDRQNTLPIPPPKLPARSSPTNLDSFVPVDGGRREDVPNVNSDFIPPTSPHVYTYVHEHK